MWLIVRYGVREMLDYLCDFCDFYVYSHGFHDYVMAILQAIDPAQKYFKDRLRTVLAPKTPEEQLFMFQNHKKFSDFKCPEDPSKPLFGEKDLQKTLIVDDTYLAIDDKEHMITSSQKSS